MMDHTLTLDLGEDRHLVVGDIHGYYDVLMRLLDKANYDPTKDIVYSVGDMIDRGPDSQKVVEFFNQDRCYSVQGNHELMMTHQKDWFEPWIKNGGEQTREDLARYCPQPVTIECLLQREANFKQRFRTMPWVIDVGEDHEEGAFRVVHAEMPAGWSEGVFQRVLNEAINANDPLFGHLVWSRKLITAGIKNVNEMRPASFGIDFHPDRYRTVFVGHTPIPRAMKVGDHWFIDTFKSLSMTMMDAVSFEKFVVKY